jgi:poly(A) polymerase
MARSIMGHFRLEGKEIYAVGGCVRDLILGKEPKDWDFCTPLLPHEIEETLSTRFTERLKITDKKGGCHGTVHATIDGKEFEITTYRLDKDYPHGEHGRRPVVEFSSSREDDLMRRDFTINAIVLDAKGDVVIDGISGTGFRDLMLGWLTSPQDPVKLFTDDPLRILRMYRFAFRFSLSVDPTVRDAVRACSPMLRIVSRERIRMELINIIKGGNAAAAIREMVEDGTMHQIVPELSVQLGYDQQNPYHHLPLLEHTIAVIDGVEKQSGDYKTLMAALLHDIAKPTSTQLVYMCAKCGEKYVYPEELSVFIHYPDDQHTPGKGCGCGPWQQKKSLSSRAQDTFVKRTFHDHDLAGARMSERILGRLKCSKEEIEDISKMVEVHIKYSREAKDWNTRSARKFVNEMSHLSGEMIKLLKADRQAHAPGHSSAAGADRLKELVSNIDINEVASPKSPMNGNDVSEITGLSGVHLGVVMKEIILRVVSGDLVTREDVSEWLSLPHRRAWVEKVGKLTISEAKGYGRIDGVPRASERTNIMP